MRKDPSILQDSHIPLSHRDLMSPHQDLIGSTPRNTLRRSDAWRLPIPEASLVVGNLPFKARGLRQGLRARLKLGRLQSKCHRLAAQAKHQNIYPSWEPFRGELFQLGKSKPLWRSPGSRFQVFFWMHHDHSGLKNLPLLVHFGAAKLFYKTPSQLKPPFGP